MIGLLGGGYRNLRARFRPACICRLMRTAIAAPGSLSVRPAVWLAPIICATSSRTKRRTKSRQSSWSRCRARRATVFRPMISFMPCGKSRTNSMRLLIADEVLTGFGRTGTMGRPTNSTSSRYHDDRQGDGRRLPAQRGVASSFELNVGQAVRGEPSGSSSSYGGNPLGAGRRSWRRRGRSSTSDWSKTPLSRRQGGDARRLEEMQEKYGSSATCAGAA